MSEFTLYFFSSNVEGRARLKQRKVDLDDAIVEDTPPSKIKARENKAKKPRLDVKESAQKRIRSRSVARGIKAKNPCSRKPQDEKKEEIRDTAYRTSLDVIFIFCMYLIGVSINFWVDTFQLV
ncbi:hypothetical protein RHMOL_Rhmol10G0266700 [Rhododendron molle]|uniref:Uncharacterized protein n=1 Tax=Rhododendron molle TaxID=49168 RepID=A0ACC0M6H9_RHOML|nr:hypothetical protein RHMOL_Rhmol10G0266700 [Rhododendron molle]